MHSVRECRRITHRWSPGQRDSRSYRSQTHILPDQFDLNGSLADQSDGQSHRSFGNVCPGDGRTRSDWHHVRSGECAVRDLHGRDCARQFARPNVDCDAVGHFDGCTVHVRYWLLHTGKCYACLFFLAFFHINIKITLYRQTDWRLISYISSLISLFAMICVYFLPETPSWLISKGRYKEAEVSMRFFRGQSRRLSAPISAACQAEFDTLLARHRSAAAQLGDSAAETLWEKFRQPGLYRPLAIMFTFFTLQQASGLFVVVVYAVKITRDAGVIMDPFLVAVYLALMRIIGTFAVGFLMDRFGRRVLCLWSSSVMGICMLGMAAYVDCEAAKAYTWLPLALILLYFLAGSLGLLTLPFTMQAEVFPQRYRGLASGLTTCVLFFMCFVFTKLYPTMVTHMGSRNVFAFYSAVSLGGVAFVYWFLPETKGKTLEQIADGFRKRAPNERRNENLMLSSVPLKATNGEKE